MVRDGFWIRNNVHLILMFMENHIYSFIHSPIFLHFRPLPPLCIYLYMSPTMCWVMRKNTLTLVYSSTAR